MEKSQVAKLSLVSALGYTLISVIATLLWRRVLFGEAYLAGGFYDFTEPTVSLFIEGVASYFLTGLLFSFLFGHMFAVSKGSASVARYSFITGAIYWVVHDFSYIGRQEMAEPMTYLAFEAGLVAIIYVLFGFVLRSMFRKSALNG
ncbi:MAG: hypothetical protein GY945_00665 [Rhodobacteraceae bacterium]|nr:hypothetical protein [Paracoccaceae bacterium]